MKVKYLLFSLMLLVGLILSACGNIAQPQVEQTTISPLPTVTQKIVQKITSPIIHTTSTPTVKKVKPIATPLPTSSPTLSPTPTVILSPTPSPTFGPLSPLDEDLETIIFTTNSKQGPKIWRVQVDEQGQQTKALEQMSFYKGPQASIHTLLPSPNGKKIAIRWNYAEAAYTSILDVTNGQATDLLHNKENFDESATFLDWFPDGQTVLVIGSWHSDLRDNLWTIDINTEFYEALNIKQTNGIPEINSASISPDGKVIAYTSQNCFECGSQINLLTLKDDKNTILFESENFRIEDVLWSPDGQYLAFTQWSGNPISDPLDKFGLGELYIIKLEDNNPQLLSSIVIHFYNYPFRPVWSPDSQYIAFVKSENVEGEKKLKNLASNIYVVNVQTNQISQITNFKNVQTIKPKWSPNSSQIAFLTTEQNKDIYKLWQVSINTGEMSELGGNEFLIDVQYSVPNIQANKLGNGFSFIWLP